MVTKILGCSVLGFVAMSALVVACASETDDQTGGGNSAIISTGGFAADCTLSTEKDGKTINGFLEGQFGVVNHSELKAGDKVYVSIGTRGKNDYTLTLKSGKIVDAKNEIFEFVASQNVKIIGKDISVMDVTVRYDGIKKVADVDSIATGKEQYAASCRFKDEAGRDTTNF